MNGNRQIPVRFPSVIVPFIMPLWHESPICPFNVPLKRHLNCSITGKGLLFLTQICMRFRVNSGPVTHWAETSYGINMSACPGQCLHKLTIKNFCTSLCVQHYMYSTPALRSGRPTAPPTLAPPTLILMRLRLSSMGTPGYRLVKEHYTTK